MRDQRAGYDERDANVYVITTGTPRDTAEFCAEHGVPFTCLVDRPGEPGYQSYGLEKVGLLRLFGPNYLETIGTLVRRFREVKNPASGDVHQLAGTFVIDAAGVLRLAYRGEYPGDHLPNEDVWYCLDSLAA